MAFFFLYICFARLKRKKRKKYFFLHMLYRVPQLNFFNFKFFCEFGYQILGKIFRDSLLTNKSWVLI